MTWSGRFLGAAEDIGRLGFVLDAEGSRFLFDYGMAPDRPPLYPLEAPPVDRVFLTHSHLDHSGMLPWLAARGDAPIHTTAISAKVAGLMHLDSLKIARLEGYPAPYNEADITATNGLYDTWAFGEEHPLGRFTATLHPAGHIPGAAQIALESASGRRLVFTGDLYAGEQRLVGAAGRPRADILFMEATYAGREHPDRRHVEDEFVELCRNVRDRGGVTLVPVFAQGRAQEIALVLAGKGFKVWMDGMARTVARMYMEHPEFLASPEGYRRALGAVKFVHGHRSRPTALKEADVIITTGGMLDGGPILWYLNELRNDPKSAIALTGYQVAGTNGHRLRSEGVVDFDPSEGGVLVHRVACEIRHFDFSAHAGHKDLVSFARSTGAGEIVLFHGEKREDLVEDLSEFARVRLPLRGEHFEMEA
ncbi:MAG: MBL fold metallo-hydrolase [Thermoplasmatota archaeon]